MDRWCGEMGIEKGAVLPIEQCWEFTKDWYADRLNPQWEPKTTAKMKVIFQKHEMTDLFWDVG